ncbi:MAG: SH3 domain-containing protein [Anaerolineales bacterium]
MDLPEETPKPEEPTPVVVPAPARGSEETFPEEPILPEGFTPIGDLAHLPRARRRRAQRMLVPPAAVERAALLDDLARRAFPSFEFFLFAFLCGAILGAAYLLNAPALLLLGILLAPLLTPWVGLTLAAVTGSWRFFFLTLGGLLVAGALVFLTGALAGLAGRLWDNLPFYYARTHAQLWWPDLLVVALGAALLAIFFVRSEQKPILAPSPVPRVPSENRDYPAGTGTVSQEPGLIRGNRDYLASVMLAYGLFLPISAAGIGLGIGRDIGGVTLWPNGLLVFLVHLALATLVGGIVLVVLRFKPMKASGYLLPVLLGLLSLMALVVFTGLATFIRDGITTARHMAPTPTTLILPSATPIVFQTPTPLPTSVPSATTLPTDTLEPTPSYAIITSPELNGANVRTEPASGTVVITLSNGLLVQVLPEIQNVGTITWVHIRVNNVEGWVLQTVLTATTLIPTPVLTPTP